MKQSVATINTKGQITVPIEIRRHLGAMSGDRPAFVIEDVGRVRVGPLPYPTIASLQRAAGSLPRPSSWREMREVASEERLADTFGATEGRFPSSTRTSSSAC